VKKSQILLLTVLALAVSPRGQLDAAVTIEYVRVGDAGNAADPQTGSLYGAVSYEYQIGKYEVTNAQYAEFLNNVAATDTFGLFSASMASGLGGGITQSGASGSFTYSVKENMGNRPVVYVSIADAMRFTNWINNGQGSATTESGVYDMTQSLATVVRNVSANVWLPTENEWHKAAYYQPAVAGGDTDNYWLFPTQSNSIPTVASVDSTGNITNPGSNVANYGGGASSVAYTTIVGSAGNTSYYGAYDLGGNVHEWTESIIGTNRVSRGGSGADAEFALSATFTSNVSPEEEHFNRGFRLSGVVPEPSRMMLSLSGILMLLLRRRRDEKARR
jgi:sulfatase modifying factor 1